MGMRMYLAQQRQESPIKLTEVRAGDEPCIKQVKKLIPGMCHVDPKERPKATKLTDALAQCLGKLSKLCKLTEHENLMYTFMHPTLLSQ